MDTSQILEIREANRFKNCRLVRYPLFTNRQSAAVRTFDIYIYNMTYVKDQP